MSSLDVQTPYILHTEDHTFLHTPISTHHASPWSWFNRIILYFPMYTSTKPDGTKRNKLCSRTIILILVLFTYVSFLIIAIIYYGFIAFDLSQPIYSINDLFSFAVHSISRIIGIYYFYFQFAYPWHSWSISLQSQTSSHYKQDLFWMSASFMFFFLQIVIDAMCGYMDVISKSLIDGMFDVTSSILIEWPSRITFIVHFALCLKYTHYLREMNVFITNDENAKIGMNEIMNLYKRIYIHPTKWTCKRSKLQFCNFANSYKCKFAFATQRTCKFALNILLTCSICII